MSWTNKCRFKPQVHYNGTAGQQSQRVLTAPTEKKHISYKGNRISQAADFSTATTQTQSQRDDIPKALRKEWDPRREIKFKYTLSMVIPTSVKGIKQCGSEIVDNSNM